MAILYYILISDDYLNLSAALTITSSRPIERIASVTGLLITAMCLPMGYFTDTMGEHPFKALGMDVNGAFPE